MSKKKAGKALFEVLGVGSDKGKKPLGVPGWFGPTQPAQPRPQPDAREPVRPVSERAEAPPAGKAKEPIASIRGGRLRICLNQVSAVVLFAGLIVLLLAAYQIGRYSMRLIGKPRGPAPTTPAGPVRRGSLLPVPALPSSPGGQGGQAGMLPDNPPRKKGYSYLVIQGGVPTRQEAMDIRKFLYNKGLNTTIDRMRHTQKYMIWDMRGFKDIRQISVQREIAEYVGQIERLGRAYLAAGGKYDFRQSRQTGPWMITAK